MLGRSVEAVCRRWLGTRFAAGQRLRGVAVDCVQLVVAVFDELCGVGPTPLPRQRQDSAMHSGSQAAFDRSLAAIAAVHPLQPVPDDDGDVILEPGDLLAVRSGRQSGPGHAMIVGRSGVYHAFILSGVIHSALPAAAEVWSVWRHPDRSRWGEVAWP